MFFHLYWWRTDEQPETCAYFDGEPTAAQVAAAAGLRTEDDIRRIERMLGSRFNPRELTLKLYGPTLGLERLEVVRGERTNESCREHPDAPRSGHCDGA